MFRAEGGGFCRKYTMFFLISLVAAEILLVQSEARFVSNLKLSTLNLPRSALNPKP